MIRKGIVKEMLEKIETQNDKKIENIRSKLNIKERQKNILVKLVNKGRKNNNSDTLKEKIDEMLLMKCY